MFSHEIMTSTLVKNHLVPFFCCSSYFIGSKSLIWLWTLLKYLCFYQLTAKPDGYPLYHYLISQFLFLLWNTIVASNPPPHRNVENVPISHLAELSQGTVWSILSHSLYLRRMSCCDVLEKCSASSVCKRVSLYSRQTILRLEVKSCNCFIK